MKFNKMNKIKIINSVLSSILKNSKKFLFLFATLLKRIKKQFQRFMVKDIIKQNKIQIIKVNGENY